MRRSAARQRGVSGAAVLVALALVAFAFVIVRALTATEVNAGGEVDTRKKLQKVSEALVRYAVENRRLPCGAQGAVATGDAAPATPTTACTDSAGVVPWKTLGLTQEDALDGWGRKISYRVYSAANGYTQAEGVSATNCNTDLPANSTPLIGGICSAAHVNAAADYTSGKGFTLNDQGTPRPGIAFALISHGFTGLGAYNVQGGRLALPTAGGNEAANAAGTAPFYAATKSGAGTVSTDVTYFDDVVVYKAQNELVSETKLVARPWGADAGTLASQSFTRTAITAITGTAPGNNLGVTAIDFGPFTITAGIAGRNLSSGVMGTGEGIGTILTGGSTSAATTLSSAANESLRITFDTAARSLGIMITDLSRLSPTNSERVRFTFYLGGSPFTTITKDQCISGHVQANYALDPGATFDRVDVAPIATTTGGGTSTILLGALRACTTDVTPSLCVVPATPTGARDPLNDCP